LILVAAGAGVAGWWYAAGQWVHAPKLTHLTAAQAKHKLAARGLHFASKDRHSDTVGTGHVIGQQPKPGGNIRRGHAVTAYISTGPRMVTVPDIGAQPLASAKKTLRKAELTVSTVHEKYSDSVDDGNVIRTQPAAGSSVKHDSNVVVYVSKGKTPITVPSVVGKSTDEARTLLSTAGFQVSVADAVYSNSYDKGVIASQSPSDTRAQPGTTVTITPSKGPHLYAVPDVTGMPIKKAVAKLKAAGFPATVTNFFGSDKVTGQRPTAGFMTRKGTTVRLLR
jgi:serine/threonine-protein kinase